MPDVAPPNLPADETTAETVRTLLESGRRNEVARLLDALHGSDLADVMGDLRPAERVIVFGLLDADKAADLLVELTPEAREDLIDSLPADQFRSALAELEPDDAADVIGEMAPEEAREALEGLEDRREIESLLEYPPDSAGGLMTTEFVTIPHTATIREAVEIVRGAAAHPPSDAVTVTDEAGRPVGRLPLTQLIFSKPDTPVAQVMDADVHAVPANMDREQVADVVRRYDLISLPVTDPATGAVKGVITIDDVFDAADEEAAEDLYRMAGAAARDPLHMPAWRRAVARLPWLLITLVPGFLVGQIMRWLGYDPGGTTALLLFVPVMIAMAGNVSLQSSTVMVRGIATGDVRTNRAMTLLLHEVVVAAMVGVACATVSGSVAYVFFGHHMGLGLVVAFSMFVGILSAATTGTMVPLTCHAIGLDPALASGPFVTSLNDITGTLIFLGLGGQLLPLLGD